MPLPTEGQVGGQPLGDDIPAALSADSWEENVQEDVQDDAQNEMNQEVPPVATAPPVSAETEVFLKHMAAAMAGAFQAQQQQQQVTVAPKPTETSFTLREFCKFNPPIFSGETDPLVAKDWLE